MPGSVSDIIAPRQVMIESTAPDRFHAQRLNLRLFSILNLSHVTSAGGRFTITFAVVESQGGRQIHVIADNLSAPTKKVPSTGSNRAFGPVTATKSLA